MKHQRDTRHLLSALTALLIMAGMLVLVACDGRFDLSPTATTFSLSDGEAALPTVLAYPGPDHITSTAAPYPGGWEPYPAGTSNGGSVEATGFPFPQETRTVSTQEAEGTALAYLPMVPRDKIPTASPTATATNSPTATPTKIPTPTPIVPTPVPTVDFPAIEAHLNIQGQALAYSKIGFHVTFMEQKGMLDEWMQQLDAAGVPFYLKTVDNAEPLYKAQQLSKASGVPHTLVFRATGGVPDYDLPPAQAALEHWVFHRDKFPPELDPSMVWVETVNEVDKNRSEWLAEFALETARLALADGFRWAAFGWAPGEPEPEHWELPAMLEFLRLVGENPDRLAIAVHEGSLSAENIKLDFPYRVGRFLQLFEICDRHGIPRPTVLITEWGWEYNNIPSINKAMQDIQWASALYASFPEVKGAAIWNLGTGCCFGDVSKEVRNLIDPLLVFNLTTYFSIPQAPAQSSTDPNLYR